MPRPVLDDTALRLEQLRAVEDALDAHLIAQALAHDPLMTLKLLAHVAGVRSAPRCPSPARSGARCAPPASRS